MAKRTFSLLGFILLSAAIAAACGYTDTCPVDGATGNENIDGLLQRAHPGDLRTRNAKRRQAPLGCSLRLGGGVSRKRLASSLRASAASS